VAVPITFMCSCGEKLQVPAESAGRMAFCLKCRRSVPIPGAQPAPEAAGSHVAQIGGDAVECLLVRGEDGKDYWKVVCSCGKHVRTLVAAGRSHGRCPKCGQSLMMPSSPQPQKTVETPGQPAPAGGKAAPAVPAKSEQDESETMALGAALAGERVNREAANVAADRLRPSHASTGGAGAEAQSRVSAWPLAGSGARLLAAFVDLTIAVMLAAIVAILASKQVLPPIFHNKEMVLIVLVLALLLNDGLIHMLLGASIGKRLVVITTRVASGKEMGKARTWLRALLKWMLVPGWLIGLVDPSGRTLHDLLCNTLVLRGRAKARRSQRN